MLLYGDLTMTNPLPLGTAVKRLERVKKIASRLIEVVSAFPNRVCYRTPDETHVSSIAMIFRSPATHQSDLLSYFLKDPDFIKSVPKDEVPLILEIGTNGYEVRANFYPMDPSETTPGFDPRWSKTGVFRYVIRADGTVTHLTRGSSEIKYDPTDVIYSYARVLELDERERLSLLFCH